MKKIMFNDKYGLTQAVLEGRKTMTRRIVPLSLDNQTDWKAVEEDGNYISMVDGDEYYHDIRKCGRYRIGEVVAVAQCYEDAILDVGEEKWNDIHKWYNINYLCHEKGLNNKMFVRADLMPHHIKITNVDVKRLQDMSVEDCLKTGIGVWESPWYSEPCYHLPITSEKAVYYNTPSAAIAALIDKVNGKGTWKNNPWCFCYEFELID